jgi:hypothetical protein
LAQAALAPDFTAGHAGVDAHQPVDDAASARIAIFGSRFALRRTSTFATTEIGRMNF